MIYCACGEQLGVQRLTRLLSQAPESPVQEAAATQTDGTEHDSKEPVFSSTPPTSMQPGNVDQFARDDALRQENEQLLLLARKQDGMLAGLQTDLEVWASCCSDNVLLCVHLYFASHSEISATLFSDVQSYTHHTFSTWRMANSCCKQVTATVCRHAGMS